VAETVKSLFNKQITEQPTYVSGGVIPRSGIVLMGGQAKIGKTFLLLDMAHALASGGSLWETNYKVIEPVPVLYCEQEVGEAEFKRRVDLRYNTMGEEPPEGFHYVSKMKNFLLDTNEGQRRLAMEIDASKAKVVIIDPIGRCLLGEENDNGAIGKLFQRFDELIISKPGLTIVIAHHFGKPSISDDYDPLNPYNFRGASKFFDAPDALMTFCPVTKSPGEWLRVKGKFKLRTGADPDEVFQWMILPGGIVKRHVEVRRALSGAGPSKGIGWGHK
jgi:AAA domain